MARKFDYYPKKTLNKAIICCFGENIACRGRNYWARYIHTAAHCSGLLSEEIMTNLIPNANWQTQQRGSNDAEYQIYVAAAESLGWAVKTYEQWLKS